MGADPAWTNARFRFFGTAGKTSAGLDQQEAAYGLFCELLSRKEVLESLDTLSAGPLQDALFDFVALVQEYNRRKLPLELAMLRADKRNLYGALAEQLAMQKGEAGEAFDPVQEKQRLIDD